MATTLIEWAKNPDGTQGFTLNSKTGCLNHTPEGLCLGGLFPCYAYKLANGRLQPLYLNNTRLAPKYKDEPLNICIADGYNPFYPRYWPEKLEQPRNRKKPTGIFLDDMSDWMGSYWPEEWTGAELQMMRDCPQHRFYTLTKQPQNLIKWSPFPDNCWVGVTATNEISVWSASFWMMKGTLEVKARIKYLSIEPLLRSIDGSYDFPGMSKETYLERILSPFNWLIIGACTGTLNDLKPTAMKYPDLAIMPYGKIWTLQPKIEWVEEIVRAADKAGIPVFLKDNLKPIITYPAHKWAWAKYVDSPVYTGLLRQEMPK